MAHVLIVDDDALVAEYASDSLINAGHGTGWVNSGKKAMNLLRRRKPDVVLLDQDMPDMSGSDVLRKLRNSADFYDLPIVMLTAVTGKHDEDQAFFAGATDYIRKPFKPEELVYRIEKIIKKRGKKRENNGLQRLIKESQGQYLPPDELQSRLV